MKQFSSNKQGTSAVEFALIAPFMLMLVAAIMAYGSLFATSLSLQQVAAEAARATIAGLSDSERESLAQGKLADIAGNYPLLDPSKVTFSFNPAVGSQLSRVTLTYDLSDHPAYALEKLLPLPPSPLSYSLIITDGNGIDS